MAKKFGNSKGNEIFNKVKETSDRSANSNIVTVAMLEEENLADYPENNEDISYTEDLELAIKENNFTDPLIITDFPVPGVPEGKYTIISGHRRRMAARKLGMKKLPCIIRRYENVNQLKNAVLMENSQRNTDRDPLLYCKRYKMHEAYLKENGFKGSVREEIARRLGISVQQADRYNKFNKVIMPIWDLVSNGSLTMSGVQGMSTLEVEEQQLLYELFMEILDTKASLNRDECIKIVNKFKKGKTTLDELLTPDEPEQTADTEPKALEDEKEIPSMEPSVSFSVENTAEKERDENTISETSSVAETEISLPVPSEEITPNINIQEEENVFGETIRKLEESLTPTDPHEEVPTQKDSLESEESNNQDTAEEEPQEDEKEPQEDKEENREIIKGEKALALIEKLDGILSDFYSFPDDEAAISGVRNMAKLVATMMEEIISIVSKYELPIFTEVYNQLSLRFNDYKTIMEEDINEEDENEE